LGFETHVATFRERAWRRLFFLLTDKRIRFGTEKWQVFRSPRFGYQFWLPKILTHKRIGLPEDGESFIDDSPETLLDRLLWLKSLGYQVPTSVIESVKGVTK
jgi:hypothetical protein